MNEQSILSSDVSRELTESLVRMRLIEPGEQPPFELLTGGVSSLIAVAKTSRGPVCIKRALPKLKVAADWFARVERNTAEVAWMKQASSIHPECVPRILGVDPAGFTFAMEFLRPETHRNWKSLLSEGQVDLDFARTVALRVAEIHRSTASHAEVAVTLNDDATFASLRLEPYYASSAQVHPDCAPALRELIATTLRTKLAVVHGDVSPKNILAGPRGPVFLDAETAWYGDPAFDLAFCLTHLLLKSVWRPAFREQYLRAFQAFVESYLRGVTWESPNDLESRAGRLLAGNLLSRVDGKSPVEYLTEEWKRNFVRQFSTWSLLHPEIRLATMAERWQKEQADAM